MEDEKNRGDPVRLVVDSSESAVQLFADMEPTEDVMLTVGSGGGTNNYEELTHKPKLNGVTIIGDMQEIDPTVPDWSKADKKPSYTAEEIGAVDSASAIPLEELALLF